MVKEMLYLTVRPPEGQPQEHRLSAGEYVIGRSSRAALSLPDARLSREHARVLRHGDGWLVEDLSSHNGTFLNGRRIVEATALRPGDVLSLGSSVIIVGRAGAATSSATSLFRSASELIEPIGDEDLESGELLAITDRLRLLNEVHRALARPITLQELLDLILDRAFAHLAPEEGAIVLRSTTGSYECAASRSVHGAGHAPFYSTHLIHEVAEKGMAALVLDVAADERFATAQSILGAGLRSLVAAPLLDPDGSLGLIVLASGVAARSFTPADMELLASLASAAALRIRNVALAEEAAESRRLAAEMALARRIQEALLPARLPDVSGWELHAANRASRFVSGDLFVATLRGDPPELTVMIVDVAGKGVPASLLTASVEALSAGPIEAGFAPEDVLDRVSARLYARTPPEKFATAFLAALRPADGSVRYANAGHLPGLIVAPDGRARWLSTSGLPLGLFPGSAYRRGETVLAPGELLALYTDGYTEAEDRSGEEFGGDRLCSLCREHLALPLCELAARLDEELDRFTGGAPLSDDRTLVLLRRQPDGASRTIGRSSP